MTRTFDYDFVVVGSGFGGSVSALRLSERGHRVAVLEQGKRMTPERAKQAQSSSQYVSWLPGLGLDGMYSIRVFRHLAVLGGVGVGGGSLVYGAVLLEPKPGFFRDPEWAATGIDWERELGPHYAEAARMLGRTTNPDFGPMDRHLQRAAEALGRSAADTFGPTPNGIYFGEAGQTVPDPFFGGQGPPRTGCVRCGGCFNGCPHNTKNTLDLNYLYLAQRQGAEVLEQHRVTRIDPQPGGGYLVHTEDPLDRKVKREPIRAERVVLAAGVLGTLELLLRCRDEHKSLPGLSPLLGRKVRTNSEALVGIVAPEGGPDLSAGAGISSHFYANPHTHITQNRMVSGMADMRLLAVPVVDDPVPARRALKTLAAMAANPKRMLRYWRGEGWHRRATLLTGMQHVDNELAFDLGRTAMSPFRPVLRSRTTPGKPPPPTFLEEANAAARAFAAACGGDAFNLAAESFANMSITAHILGGCVIGASREQGVIDTNHEVYGHPGLYVMDGSALPSNVGVNPSLTITALAERAIALLANKGKSKPRLVTVARSAPRGASARTAAYGARPDHPS